MLVLVRCNLQRQQQQLPAVSPPLLLLHPLFWSVKILALVVVLVLFPSSSILLPVNAEEQDASSYVVKKSWTLLHSLGGGGDGEVFRKRGSVTLSLLDEEKATNDNLDKVKLEVTNDDDAFKSFASPDVLARGLYKLKLVPDNKKDSDAAAAQAFSVMTSVPGCQLLRSNFR